MTSVTHPLIIDEVSIPEVSGKIGMTLCAGKKSYSYYSERFWNRDLDLDLKVIKEWPTAAVVTLIEEHEFDLLKVRSLPDKVRELGMMWFHLPIEDVNIPKRRFERLWFDVLPLLLELLRSGNNLVVNCRAGEQRGPMVTALLLIECGMSAQDALYRVRTARPVTNISYEQELYVLNYKPILYNNTRI
jgi:protein-tyrosine phosphatase